VLRVSGKLSCVGSNRFPSFSYRSIEFFPLVKFLKKLHNTNFRHLFECQRPQSYLRSGVQSAEDPNQNKIIINFPKMFIHLSVKVSKSHACDERDCR